MQSMTGFGQALGQWYDAAQNVTWHWSVEVKSVNHRALDVRVRAGGAMDDIERDVRNQIADRLHRGAVQVSVQYDRVEEGTSAQLSLDTQALTRLADQLEALDGRRPTALELLHVKGMLVSQDDSKPSFRDTLDPTLRAAVLASVQEALGQLLAKRQEEGMAMQQVLRDQLDQMTQALVIAKAEAASVPQALKMRLEKNLQALQAGDIDPDRLAQEVALLAAKADVTEEVERFDAHIASALGLLDTKGSVGRKLEFLAQEFNREANTLCSKSGSIALTNAGLALKGLIDQWREQSANIE